jgi:hypothetical protein
MNKIRRVTFALVTGFLCVAFAPSCSHNDVYGVYSFQMGRMKETHFYVSMELKEDSALYDTSKQDWAFHYENVSVKSSTEELSSNPGSPESSSLSDSTSQSVSASGESSSSTDEESLFPDTLELEGDYTLGEDGTIATDLYLPGTESSSEPVIIPAELFNTLISMRLSGDTIDIRLPVSVHDALTLFADLLESTVPGEDEVHTVDITLTKE